MKKAVLFTFVFLAIIACNNNVELNGKKEDADSISKGKPALSSITQTVTDTSKVKAWLTGVIESYLNVDGKDLKVAYNNLRLSLTDSYYNYKQDAINLTYDGGDTTMTKETFDKKWGTKYDTKFVGDGGFLISSNDNGKVKVRTCDFIKQPAQNSYLYKVVIEDLDFKIKYKRDIKVIRQGNNFLIDDIVVYN